MKQPAVATPTGVHSLADSDEGLESPEQSSGLGEPRLALGVHLFGHRPAVIATDQVATLIHRSTIELPADLDACTELEVITAAGRAHLSQPLRVVAV